MWVKMMVYKEIVSFLTTGDVSDGRTAYKVFGLFKLKVSQCCAVWYAVYHIHACHNNKYYHY